MSSALKGCEDAFWTWQMSVMCLWALLRRRSSAMRLQKHRAGRPWRSSKCSSQSPSPILGHLVLFCFHIWLGPTNCPKPACSHSTEALGSSHFSPKKLSGNEPFQGVWSVDFPVKHTPPPSSLQGADVPLVSFLLGFPGLSSVYSYSAKQYWCPSVMRYPNSVSTYPMHLGESRIFLL